MWTSNWSTFLPTWIGRSNRASRSSASTWRIDFANNQVVRGFLEHSGEEALPLILVDGEVALAGRYPHRSELARWAGIAVPAIEIKPAEGCCSGSKCC